MKQNVEQQLVALKRYFISQLPNKIGAIESAWQEYLDHPDHDTLQVLYRQAHNMSGSAGTYGYKEISDIAKKMDKILRVPDNINLVNKQRISDLIAQLKNACNKIS